MALYFEIIRGKSTGNRFKISPGARIGRGRGEIPILEPRASSLHAKIEQDATGGLVLVDLDSTNGLKINGLDTKQTPLKPGDQVKIGSTVLLVTEVVAVDETQLTANLVVDPETYGWKAKIKSEVLSLKPQNFIPSKQPFAFSPAVVLRFLEGPQAGQFFILGWGPRSVGPGNSDLNLVLPGMPNPCFNLFQNPLGKLCFTTNFPGQVLLNNHSVSESELQSGDLIQIGPARIRIDRVQNEK